MTHIDLFSGIGGFSIASGWAGFETIVFVEIDPFCQKVLHKHWPEVKIEDDIRKFDGTKYRGATLLTAGVPCQPASCAGKRRGTKDDRWLWPETFRIIREARPKWLILENVRGLITLEGGVVFQNLLSELEAIGYETRTFIIPACAVNAPHRRDRVWIIAYNIGEQEHAATKSGLHPKLGGENRDVANTEGGNGTRSVQIKSEQSRPGRQGVPDRRCGWSENWYEVATRFCGMDDGVPGRVDRLKSLGNAIVPAVAYEILKGIAEMEI